MNDEDFNALKIRFDEKWTPEPFSGCWIWTMGGGHVYGYGQFDIRGKKHSAHRISWMLYHGVIPNGMSVLHRCDTTACVNPDHLFLGTQADNMRDSQKKGNRPHGENHWYHRLTSELVIAIRNDRRSSQRVIARELGVSQSTVCDIRKRKRWKHI